MSASQVKTDTKVVYRILNERDELSSGGTYPRFGQKGKTWLNLGTLRSHITLVGKRSKRRPDLLHPYDHARVVCYELREVKMDEDPIAKALTLMRLKAL